MRKALLVLVAMALFAFLPLASEAQTGKPSTPETGPSAETPVPIEPLFLATFEASGTSGCLEADGICSSGQSDHNQYELLPIFATTCPACFSQCGATGGQRTREGCFCC